MASSKYPSLNGLRAISILLVIFSHLKDKLTQWSLFKFVPFLTDGQLGVNVFFVISGFLITSLLIKEEQSNGNISFRRFYIRRTLRIFPAYYFLLLVYFVLDVLNMIDLSSASWLSSVTYTKYFNWRDDWFTAHAWSLSIEEHFYLAWPLMFAAGKRSRQVFLAFIILACPMFRWISLVHPMDWLNQLTIFHRLDSIAIGCVVAFKQEQIVNMLNRFKVLPYVAMLWILAFPFAVSIGVKVHPMVGRMLIPLGNSIGTFTNVAIACIVLFSVHTQKGSWFRFLNLRVMEQIGILSYSIYLWQQLFTSELPVGESLFPYNFILILAASLFSYYVIEKPFLKLKEKFSVKPKAYIRKAEMELAFKEAV